MGLTTLQKNNHCSQGETGIKEKSVPKLSRTVLNAEVRKADAYLKGQGISDDVLQDVSTKARRLLAGALERELKEFGTLNPAERRKVENDLIETVQMGMGRCEREEVDERPASPETLASNLLGVGCKTTQARLALEGIYAVLKA
ncbi:MAG: hypothetical protein WCK46_03050 [Candidatus Adlerbacteria bacterium]